MKRMVILSTAMVAALLLGKGAALAANVICDGGLCRGTEAADTLRGSKLSDTMYGLGGPDRMGGSLRPDVIVRWNRVRHPGWRLR